MRIVATVDADAPSRGLGEREAARRLAEHGPNEVTAQRPARIWSRIGRQLADPLVVLLIAAAVVTIVLGDVTDTVVIALVVLVNTAIGVTQEVRADRAVAALHQAAAPTARVIRDGADRVIPAPQVVPGDLIVLTAGDIVPADATLDEAQRFTVNEAALTGESLPVDRLPGQVASAGTVVLTGRAQATVVRTGPASALGRIATLVAAARPGPTPLQRRLAKLSRTLGLVAVAASVLVMVLGILAGRPVADMAITAVSLVVAAVPESLPAVVTLALALGAARMARAHAITRRLDAVETLGSVTVIASDKTGTVTEGRMAVERARTVAGTYHVRGSGYEPTGDIHRNDIGGAVLEPPYPGDLTELARAAALCNDAVLLPPDDENAQWSIAGDPIEGALVAFACRVGVDVERLRTEHPRIAEVPFDLATRMMTTVHATSDGRHLVVCKGAPEAISAQGSLAEQARELAERGLRVMAVASATRDDPTTEVPLRLLGLVGIGDPVREGAADVACRFDEAGVRLVMITGDHPVTASAIAGRLGIWADGDEVALGDAELSDEAMLRARVFARTQPDRKLQIVSALQRSGQVVAMNGDGVNDSPALRQADIGVAMGGSGTQVARQAADLVLTDDNLATVATAIGEGRRVYDNIRRFLRYALSGGLAEIAVMLTGPFVGLAVPLLPAQILWVNLLTHGLPGVAMGAEPADPQVLRRPPRPPEQSVLGAGLGRSVLWTGFLITLSVLGVALWAERRGMPWQSMAFVTLGLAQLGVALAVRAPRGPGREGNPWLGLAVALSVALQVAAVAVGPLRELFGTVPLTVGALAACFAAAVLPGGAIALLRGLRAASSRMTAP